MIKKGFSCFAVLMCLLSVSILMVACGGGDETEYVYVSYTDGINYTVKPVDTVLDGRICVEKSQTFSFHIEVTEGYDTESLVVKFSNETLVPTSTVGWNVYYSVDNLLVDATLTVSEPSIIMLNVDFKKEGTDYFDEFKVMFKDPATDEDVTKNFAEADGLESFKVSYGTEFSFTIFEVSFGKFDIASVSVSGLGEDDSVIIDSGKRTYTYAAEIKKDSTIKLDTSSINGAINYLLDERSLLETDLYKISMIGSDLTYDGNKKIQVALNEYAANSALYNEMKIFVYDEEQNHGVVLGDSTNGYYVQFDLQPSPSLYDGCSMQGMYSVFVTGITPDSTLYKTMMLSFGQAENFDFRSIQSTRPYHINYDFQEEKVTVYYPVGTDIKVVMTLLNIYNFTTCSLDLTSSISVPGEDIYYAVNMGDVDPAKTGDGYEIEKAENLNISGNNQFVFILLTLTMDKDYEPKFNTGDYKSITLTLVFPNDWIMYTAFREEYIYLDYLGQVASGSRFGLKCGEKLYIKCTNKPNDQLMFDVADLTGSSTIGFDGDNNAIHYFVIGEGIYENSTVTFYVCE